MSTTTWNEKWEPLSYKLDEWLLLKDELDKKEVNDPLLKLTKQEIAEQVLHDIEDLGRNNTDDWLDEFPPFEEIQTLTPAENIDVENEQKSGNYDLKFEQERFSSNASLVVPEIHIQPHLAQDLFSVSYENSATFILSNENVLYINSEPFVNFTPLQSECAKVINNQEQKSPSEFKKKNSNLNVQHDFSWNELYSTDVKKEMAVVEEIIRNTALELDPWESESFRSDISSDGTSASDFSWKEKGEETDDPDWKPETLQLGGRKSVKRSKPYWRGGSQEEKKLRKKEQNKNAATRYRQKKKAEVSEILKEEESLKEKKSRLEEKVTDIQSEIKCLKALMRDLFKAKGIIK